MTVYVATIELDRRTDLGKHALELANALQSFSPAVGTSPTGWLSATVSFPADNLARAIATALGVVEAAAGVPAIGIEVITEQDLAARQGFVAVPSLISTTDFAALMGISKPTVAAMIERHELTTAQKVGGTTVIARSEALAKAAAAGRDIDGYAGR
jgi:hypothetical protein